MSRSKRKPYCKAVCDRKNKAIANRKIRNAKDIPQGSGYRKVFESWDICDIKFYDPKNKKISRK